MRKFTLRDLFALVTIAALLLGWLVDHRRQAELEKENQRLAAQLEVMRALAKEMGYTVRVTLDGPAVASVSLTKAP
jgi:Flp pilus assembly protein TadB